MAVKLIFSYTVLFQWGGRSQQVGEYDVNFITNLYIIFWHMLFNNLPFPHNSKVLSNGYRNTLLANLTKIILLWKCFLLQIYLVVAALQLTWYWLAGWILCFVGRFVTFLHSWFWLTAFFVSTLYFNVVNEDGVWVFLWWGPSILFS